MHASMMTTEHDAIVAEITAAEATLERYDHVAGASPAEIARALKAVNSAIDADMAPGLYVGLRTYLSIYATPTREAERRRRFGA